MNAIDELKKKLEILEKIMNDKQKLEKKAGDK